MRADWYLTLIFPVHEQQQILIVVPYVKIIPYIGKR